MHLRVKFTSPVTSSNITFLSCIYVLGNFVPTPASKSSFRFHCFRITHRPVLQLHASFGHLPSHIRYLVLPTRLVFTASIRLFSQSVTLQFVEHIF
jgi:hypothetical protein